MYRRSWRDGDVYVLMTGPIEQKDGKVYLPTKKGTGISGGATGLALLIAWLWQRHTGETMPPEPAIVLAGGLAFVISWIVAIVNALFKKLGINTSENN